MAAEYEGNEVFLRRDRLYATPLLIALVEITELLFAVEFDSGGAFDHADRYVVYTSNVFAVVGLRSLFLALFSLLEIFDYLHYGISCILVFAGIKMLLSHYYLIRTTTALLVLV